RRDVARAEAGAAGRHDEGRLRGEVDDGVRDRRPLVRDDPSDDVEAVLGQQAGKHVAAPVLARPGGDAVGDGQHRRFQTGSFVFSTRCTDSTTISLSIALAMSYTVSAATDAATSASISTPVCAVVSAVAVSSTAPSTSSARTSTFVSGSGWQSGIRSLVRFAAMIPASSAAARASPFGSSRSCAAVAGATL